MKDATVAIEDERFYQHKGVDFEGVVRAALKNASSGKTLQGGSTLTMQLIRTLYTGSTREDVQAQGARGEARRGARERPLGPPGQGVDPHEVPQLRALRDQRRPDRGRRPGGGAGVLQQAGLRSSRCAESALLAGLPQAPSQYNPFREPGPATARRNAVLRKMADVGFITDAAAQRGDRARRSSCTPTATSARSARATSSTTSPTSSSSATASRPCAAAG